MPSTATRSTRTCTTVSADGEFDRTRDAALQGRPESGVRPGDTRSSVPNITAAKAALTADGYTMGSNGYFSKSGSELTVTVTVPMGGLTTSRFCSS